MDWQKTIREAQQKRRQQEVEEYAKQLAVEKEREEKEAGYLKQVLGYLGIDATPTCSYVVIDGFRFCLRHPEFTESLQLWESKGVQCIKFSLFVRRLIAPFYTEDEQECFLPYSLTADIVCSAQALDEVNWSSLQADLADAMDMLDEYYESTGARLEAARSRKQPAKPELPENLQAAVGYLETTIADIELGCCTPAQHLLIAMARLLDTLPQPAFQELTD